MKVTKAVIYHYLFVQKDRNNICNLSLHTETVITFSQSQAHGANTCQLA